MYDEVMKLSREVPSKQSEIIKVINEIKDELFDVREQLSPVLKQSEVSVSSQSEMSATPLMQEMINILEIVKALKQDIYL